MAVDKAVDSVQLNSDLTSIADAIRTKGGTSSQLAFPSGFISAIEAINGGIDISDYLDTDISGMDVVYQNSNIVLDGHSVIHTGIKLFSSENINKDFKIIITDLYSDISLAPRVDNNSIFCSKSAVSPYPGFTCRPRKDYAVVGSNNGNIVTVDKTLYPGLIVSRKNGVILADAIPLFPAHLSFAGTKTSLDYLALSASGNLATVTDTPFVLGGELEEDNITGRRFCGGTIGSITIAIQS